MGKEIIINAEREQTRIAIIEDGELAELYYENPGNERTIGNIFLGRIRRIMPSIQAAFVDIGQKQDAFLHFSDLADNLPEWIEFLKDTRPEVGKVEIRHHETTRPVGNRRRPRGGRRGGLAHADDDLELDDSDRDDSEQLDAEGVDAEVVEETPRQHHPVVDAQARGKRRSAQRRSTRKGQKQDRALKDDTRPAPRGEDIREEPEEEDQSRQGRRGSSASRGRKNERRGADDRNVRRPENYLRRDQRILVKISKEPISAKGSRVTTDISLAGRFLVLVPLTDYIAVSKKIYSYKERRRLRALAKSLVPEGFGVIVRTVAQGKNAKALDTDLRLLLEKWRKIEQRLQGNPKPPLVLHEDVNMVSSVIRDLFSDDYDRILIDDPDVYRNIKGYIQAVAPHMVPAVRLHQSKKPIFEAAGIDRTVSEAFESRVNLPSGGYLFIEHTEAMHVVDVNSGRAGQGLTQEQNSLRVNLEAARIIARQVRLRDLGGIIVIDFIDMRDEKNRKKLFEELRKEFRRDRAVTKILPMSDFGLMQITRQRLRPSFTTTHTNGEVEPEKKTDKKSERDRPERDRPERDRPERDRSGRDRSGRDRSGRGRPERDRPERKPRDPVSTPADAFTSPEALIENIEHQVVEIKNRDHLDAFRLKVHPFTAAYLQRGLMNCLRRWRVKHFVRVNLETDESLHPMAFRLYDAESGKELAGA